MKICLPIFLIPIFFPFVSFHFITAVNMHVKAVMTIWTSQCSRDPALRKSNPRDGAALKGFLNDLKRNVEIRHRRMFLDNGVGTLLDGYEKSDVYRICRYFWEKNSLVGLRSLVDFIMGHAMFGRSEDKRRALLSNLFLWELDDEGPIKCFSMVCTKCTSDHFDVDLMDYKTASRIDKRLYERRMNVGLHYPICNCGSCMIRLFPSVFGHCRLIKFIFK